MLLSAIRALAVLSFSAAASAAPSLEEPTRAEDSRARLGALADVPRHAPSASAGRTVQMLLEIQKGGQTVVETGEKVPRDRVAAPARVPLPNMAPLPETMTALPSPAEAGSALAAGTAPGAVNADMAAAAALAGSTESLAAPARTRVAQVPLADPAAQDILADAEVAAGLPARVIRYVRKNRDIVLPACVVLLLLVGSGTFFSARRR